MGYPMTYKRVIGRNQLDGVGYTHTDARNGQVNVPPAEAVRSSIRGDLRRLEQDCRDERHLRAYAIATDLTPEQVKRVLDLFFAGTEGIVLYPEYK